MVVEKENKDFHPGENWIKKKFIKSKNVRYGSTLLPDNFSLAWCIYFSMYLLPVHIGVDKISLRDRLLSTCVL